VAVALGAAAPAHAGKLELWADSAYTLSGSGCTKVVNNAASNEAYTTINCPDAAGGTFVVPFAIPEVAAATGWTYRIHYAVSNNSTSSTCAWDVQLQAQTSDGTVVITGGPTTTVTAGPRDHTAGKIDLSPTSAAMTGIRDSQAGANCSGSTCTDTGGVALVTLNNTSTSGITGTCNFRLLEITY